MDPSFDTTTHMWFTDYIPSTDPTEVLSPQKIISPLPYPGNVPSLLPQYFPSLALSHVSQSILPFDPSHNTTYDPDS